MLESNKLFFLFVSLTFLFHLIALSQEDLAVQGNLLYKRLRPSKSAVREGNRTEYPYYVTIPALDDFEEYAGIRPKAFEPWTRPIPCYPSEPFWYRPQTQQTAAGRGIVYNKLFKTGSSTASGVNIRIARNLARRNNHTTEVCRNRFFHWPANELFPQGRKPRQTFLWTTVRDPTRRILSQIFFFMETRRGLSLNDTDVLKHVSSGGNGWTYNQYMARLPLQSPEKLSNETDMPALAQSIFDDYDFVGISERLDESLVALSMLMNLPLGDVLYLSTKDEYALSADNRQCTEVAKARVPDIVKEYMLTDDWQQKIYWDHAVFVLANRSLDLTIDRLGRTAFEDKLETFRKMQEEGKARCADYVPCATATRRYTDCVVADTGCGNECLDGVVRDLAPRQNATGRMHVR